VVREGALDVFQTILSEGILQEGAATVTVFRCVRLAATIRIGSGRV